MSYEILNKEILYDKEKKKQRNERHIKNIPHPRRKKGKEFKKKMKIISIVLFAGLFTFLCIWTYTTFLKKTNNIEISGRLLDFEKNITAQYLHITSSDTNIEAENKKSITNKKIELKNFIGKLSFENGFLILRGNVDEAKFNKERLENLKIEIDTSEKCEIELEVENIDFEIKNPSSKIGKTNINSKEKTKFFFEDSQLTLIIESQNKKIKIFSDTENIKKTTKTIDLTYKKYDE